MLTEIPRQQWGGFLEAFSSAHRAWLVDIDAEPRTGRAVLEAITVQLAGSTPAVALVVRGHDGTRPTGHVMYSIPRPSRIAVEQDQGTEKKLVVGSEDGRTTVVRFHQVVQPPVVPPGETSA